MVTGDANWKFAKRIEEGAVGNKAAEWIRYYITYF